MYSYVYKHLHIKPESTSLTHLSPMPETPPLGIHSFGFRDCFLLKWKYPWEGWTQCYQLSYQILSNWLAQVKLRNFFKRLRKCNYYSPGKKKAQNTLYQGVFYVTGTNKRHIDWQGHVPVNLPFLTSSTAVVTFAHYFTWFPKWFEVVRNNTLKTGWFLREQSCPTKYNEHCKCKPHI